MKTSQIAAQLYTCRQLLQTPQGIVETLTRVRAAGYTAVQVSGMAPFPEEELSRILDGEGLVCCATHEPSDNIRFRPEIVIERLQKLRCTYTAYPYPASVQLDDPSSLASLAADLEKAAGLMKEAGITLAYHNHGIEFIKTNGVTALDFLLAAAPTVQAELDTYWVQYGGGDVAAWCEKLANRLPLIHLKDYMFTSEGTPHFCEIGAGNLDFRKIISAAEASGCEWFIVEQDSTPGDPVDSLKQSFEYLSKNIAKN